MLKIILFLFVAIPLLELYVLIEVGSGLGGFTTIALCLLTAALGGLLIRIQGIKTLLAAQQQAAHGQLPAEHALHGILLAVAGLSLFLPGFITDSLGFLLLIPAFRLFLMRFFIATRNHTSAHTPSSSTVIEAEVIKEDKHIQH